MQNLVKSSGFSSSKIGLFHSLVRFFDKSYGQHSLEFLLGHLPHLLQQGSMVFVYCLSRHHCTMVIG